MKKLYGGAIEVDFEDRFEDVSMFRQVPDHQEVFTDASSDQSIIFELNQMAEESNERVSTFYWEDSVSVNECEGFSTLDRVEMVELKHLKPSICDDPRLYCCKVEGTQKVSKFNEPDEARNLIRVTILIIRLSVVQTDFIVTITTPMQISEHSSSARMGTKLADPSSHERIVQDILCSLCIKDWGMFG